ncbi:uncharacterized protein LOC111196954 [Astyanax mexicanus]|nr:uncharacterized protein LOC111196954 [Astyanax mexicanus]
MEELLPADLVKFLNLVLTGRADIDGEKCEKTQRLVYSITQDVCRAATNSTWKLPKHILLCATVRHLYRSKQLTTILARLGHSETYDFGMELETAMAKAFDEMSTYLTPQIISGKGNCVFHSEWDNLNRITTNVLGSNVVNSAGGIMIQEVKEGHQSTNERILPLYERSSKMRSLKITPPETLPELVFKRDGPKFPKDASFTHPVENQQSYDASMLEYYIYLLCRRLSSEGKQQVPGFGGFISSTGKVPPRKSTIDFYTPINQPITDNAVVYELLKRSEAATEEVGQPYTINTFDLGVVMKACPIVWKYEEEFKKHIIILGKFHTAMNYIGKLTGYKCQGSGYAEILIEANLATSGCLKNILSGKAYAKALFGLKVVTEALERLLINVFLEEENLAIPQETLTNLVHCCSRENLDAALKDHSLLKMIHQYIGYQQKVREGHLGKTSMFWLSVMDHARLVFMLDFAVKTNNFELFHYCNGAMAELIFAYDGHNYARYLTWFEAFLINIDISHPGALDIIKLGAIAVARSLIPGALSAVDKTMEETFMKFAKSSGGLLGLFNMFGAYQKWCRTTSARAQLHELTLEMCGMIDDPDCPKRGKHRELEPAQIRKQEEAVQRVILAISGFTNPWKIPDKKHLYSLASGAPVDPEVEVDVLQAEAAGRAAKEKFIDERFVSKKKGFFEPLNKLKLKTMYHSSKKIKLTSAQGKVFMYQEQSNLAFQLLVKSQMLDMPFDLEELMHYPLSPVPHALGTPDGFFAKTNKATILHYLLQDRDEEVIYPKDALFIQDGNALFHMMTNLQPTCGEICMQLLDHMIPKQHFVFSTDCYQTDSIKAQERVRRGSTENFIIGGPHTHKPCDFKCFLSNEVNKKQLCDLLLKVWGSNEAASRLEKCKRAVVCVDGRSYDLTSTNGQVQASEIHALRSNQEETDTRVVLYLHQAVKWGYKSSVVRTPDTDILLILLYHASRINLTILLDHGTGLHRKLVNVSELAESLGSEYCSTLLGYYVFSGEDCTSAFKGKGKVAPLKKLQQNPRFQKAFSQLGTLWQVSNELQQEMESFTCVMYGHGRLTSIDAVRVKMLQKMVGVDRALDASSKVDLERLPPPKVCLIPHTQRVNYRVACYKRAEQPIFERPNPYDQGMGWEKTMEEGVLEPVWSVGPIFPPSLVDILAGVEERESIGEGTDDVEEGTEIEEIDFDDLFNDDDEDENY